tara:strand:+ start:80 stop:784 length:705 start_codon:yes stop_codon:yes gene_type:complete
MKTKQIDVLVTSASRLDYLKLTIDSLRQNLKFSGKLNWIIHEDAVKQAASQEVVRWINKNKFDVLMVTNPAKRQGKAVLNLLKMSKTEFVIRTEDDWVLQRQINLDEVIQVLEENNTVNQISFSKRNNGLATHYKYKEYTFSKFKLCLNPNWSFILGVWRKNFILPKWIATERGDDIGLILRQKDGVQVERSEDWLVKNIGAYWWGGMDKGEFVAHIGLHSVLQSPIKDKEING